MKLRIENLAPGKNVCGRYTRVFVVDDDGTEVEISNMVRSADVRLHVDELVTAKLEVFVTDVEVRADLETALLKHLKPRRIPWLRRARDITGFNRNGVKEFIVR